MFGKFVIASRNKTTEREINALNEIEQIAGIRIIHSTNE